MKDDKSTSSRRHFLKTTCSAFLALSTASSGVLIVGCDSGSSSPPPLPDGIILNGTTLTIDLAQFPNLTQDRGALWVASQDVFIIRVADEYRAFSSVCPHEQEDVNIYEPNDSSGYQLRCPAHDWTFDLDGTPTGIADARLQQYATRLDGNLLEVTLA